MISVIGLVKKLINKTNYVNDIHILRTKFRRNSTIKNIKDSWREKPKGKNGLEFFNWFDSINDLGELEVAAERDFKFAVSSRIPLDKTKTILEIGFGGGRLAAQACKACKHYYGIDIYENFENTIRYLKKKDLRNFNLYNSKEKSKISSFNLVYSFIVIQHFSSIKVLESYLDFISEKITDDGIAILWYGKLKTNLFGPFYEVPANQFRERECSLFITKKKMEFLITERGFNLINHSVDNKTSDSRRQSMQSFVIFSKK